jgi:hypothetical protein
VRISPDEIHVRDPTWYDVLYVSNLHARDKYPPTARMAGTPLAGMYLAIHLHIFNRKMSNFCLFVSLWYGQP